MINIGALTEGTSKWVYKKVVSKVYEYVPNDTVVYKIIPHASITTNNKRLWKMIYKMYEMYEKPGTRLERNKFKFTLREKDRFWFDVIFKQENGKKSIEFYVATSEYQAQKLKRKIENKMDVTFKEASIDDLQVPYENTIVQELRYLRHDIFALNSSTQDTKIPISGLLNVVDELQFDGDMARFSICNEVQNRNKWVRNAQWTYEKIQKGKIPQRSNANGKVAYLTAKTVITSIINELFSFITDVFNALSNVFFKSKDKFEDKKFLSKIYSLEDEIGTTYLSKEKGNQPVFKSHIRLAAHSEDRLTRDTLAESIALSMQDLSETNELTGVKINNKKKRKRIIDELNTMELSPQTKRDMNVNIVSTDEMSKLALMMPNRELQLKYADALSVKTRTEVTIPGVMRDPNGIFLGMAQLKDEQIDIFMPVSNYDNFYRGYVFIGGQGAGKDTAIRNWVVECNLKHNISFVIPDAIVEEGDRGMADGIRDSLPPDRIIDLNMNDEDFIPPMDLTEVVSALGRNGASRFADEMIDFMQIEGLSRSERYLTEAAKASKGSLFNIKRIIEDENYRFARIEELMKEGNLRLANSLVSWGTNEELGSKADPILNRLNRFFGNERLYDIFAQDPLKELDFRKWMAEGKVIILRVPNGKGLGEHAVKTLVHWITLKAFMTRMLMTKEEQKNGCFIIFNEPEQYESEGLSKLMGRIATEGRKERLGSIYAFHHWNKLSSTLQENLQGGGVQQFLFANDHKKTFDLSAHRFADYIPVEEAYKLPDHHAIISVRANKELQPAFICQMHYPGKPQYDNSFLTLRHARMYGRSWNELQRMAL